MLEKIILFVTPIADIAPLRFDNPDRVDTPVDSSLAIAFVMGFFLAICIVVWLFK